VVHIEPLGKPCGKGGLVKRLAEGLPVVAVQPPHRHRAIRAVKVVVYIQVGLKLAEKGQNLKERPLLIALGGPVVVVFGQTA
jgi:hypothetical protein